MRSTTLLPANGRNGHSKSRPRRVLVTGAAGAPALNYIRSLRKAPERYYLVGADCNKYQLPAAETDECHLVPRASDPDYIPVLNQLIEDTGAEFIWVQPDVEVAIVSQRRDELNVRTFLPSATTVAICHDKFRSFACWQEAGLPVPETRMIDDYDDLAGAMADFGELWLRAAEGAAGRGSLRTADLEYARMWVDSHDGWGRFTAARYLSPDSVTWQSIWNDGELVVAQGRRRLQWEFADRAPSGITGITGVGMTIADEQVDEIARRAVLAVDPEPHGIYAVDMTRDADGVPNLTEINIGRFFTTTYFFTAAGLNMPYIVTKLALGEEPPLPARRINPLEPGLLWVRGMDREPVLSHVSNVTEAEAELAALRARLRTRPPVS